MVDRTESDDVIDPVSNTDALQVLTHLHDTRDWAGVVEFTDAWLEARGTLPATAAHFRSAGLQGVRDYQSALMWAALACRTLTSVATDADRVAWVASRINLGQCFARLGEYVQAKRIFRAALRIPVTDPDARVALGHLRLCLKPRQWAKGWRDHEARIGTDRAPAIPGVPMWDGGPTTGPVVVLHEQGIGDAILFARWLPWVAERSGHPVIWAGPAFLHRWMQSLPGVGSCLSVDDALLVPDGETVNLAQGVALVRAMSLPALHGTKPDTIPAPAAPAVIFHDPSTPFLPHRPVRVGVCWAGAQGGHHDFERSFDPATFAHLWSPAIPNVEYVSLQYATEPPEGAPFDAMPTGDVYATAERIVSCDLVVSVDTSVVHIAGSLHIPTLCLTPTTPDWRYPNWPEGSDTPWYGSVVVIRRDKAAAHEDQIRTAKAVAEDMVAAILARS